MTGVDAPPRHVLFRCWRGEDLERGSHQGTAVVGGALVVDEVAGTLRFTDPYDDAPSPTTYEWSAWVSPEVATPFPATAVMPSWNASTPGDSWLAVEARVAVDDPGGGRRWSRWFTLAHWADSDREIHPTSVPGQDDASTRVSTDVLEAAGGVPWSAHQVRVTLLRRPGSTARPEVRMVGVMASNVPQGAPEQVSRGGAAWGVELPVPAYSQQLHRGVYEHWDSGGSSWCSPTSTSMLLAFHDRLPVPGDYDWVAPDLPNRFVVQAARHVFDYAYGGAGNWAFNTAYAGRPGATAFVTRLRSLAEAEILVAAGIPIAATVSFGAQGLTGAGYATEGHLLTIVGFTGTGDVVCNDPASHQIPSDDAVRVVYDRAEFERVWLGSAGGVVYVVHPDDVPLPRPPDPAEPNW
jgi:hypothetical protein